MRRKIDTFEKRKKKEEVTEFVRTRSNKLLMEALCQLAIYIDSTQKL